jgi:integrative and conjugative element protein (TIGR02256 family)
MIQLSFADIGPVIIEESACVALNSYRQKRFEFEKAGVVAGFKDADGAWHISRVMPPSKNNKASRNWVYRDKASAQRFIDREFRNSSGLVNYLGEWHTHPCVNPKPSGDDKQMLTDLLRSSVMAIDFLIGIIVAETGNACCWAQRYTKDDIIIYPQQDFRLEK